MRRQSRRARFNLETSSDEKEQSGLSYELASFLARCARGRETSAPAREAPNRAHCPVARQRDAAYCDSNGALPDDVRCQQCAQFLLAKGRWGLVQSLTGFIAAPASAMGGKRQRQRPALSSTGVL